MRTLSTLSLLLSVLGFHVYGQAVVTYTKPATSAPGKFSRPMPVIDQKKDDNAIILLSDGRLIHTEDKGKSWGMDDTRSKKSPEFSMAFTNKKGDVFLTYLSDDRKLHVSVSGDHGRTWKDLGQVLLDDIRSDPVIYFDQEKQRMFVSYLSGDECEQEIRFIQTSNGKKWTDPVPLNHESLPCNSVRAAADLVLGPHEYLYGLWSQEGSLLLDRSVDGGERWLRSDIKVKDVSADKLTGGPVLAVDNSISVLSGSVYVFWTETGDNGDILKCIRSSNAGDFWNTEVVVNEEENHRIYAPVSRIDRSNGFLYVMYFTGNDGGTYDLHLAYSDNGAQSFAFHKKINEEPVSVPDTASLPRVAGFDVFNGRIIISWTEVRDGEEHVSFKYLSYEDI